MAFLERIFGTSARRELDPLYRAIVAIGRDPAWYRDGQVPDTLDGRFDMMAAIIALVLLRLEREGQAGRDPSILLIEIFVADMDSSLREIGIGEYVVGKHVGRLMGALGGRLGALRDAQGEGASLEPFVRRNLFHGDPPGGAPVAFVAGRLEALARGLDALPLSDLLVGRMPGR